MTTVINIFGEPSSGKSTLAAELYAKMKKKGLKVELVREFAKELAWNGQDIGPFDQMAIIGEQIRRESSLFGKVDYIITDSPAMLGAFYMDYNHNQSYMTEMVKNYISYAENEHEVNFRDVLISRQGDYENSGRYETEEQSAQMRENLVDFLNENRIIYERFVDMKYFVKIKDRSLAW